MSAPSSYVPSPCVKICALDPVTQLCRGCYRSMEEIADWLEYTADEKLEVLARVEQRRAAEAASTRSTDKGTET
ncbi:MAG TPA: DUF1289 domain-containing protein [Burkholderiales bacterium]|nr:DUF1289 domain-containing protein [Burkholderiales bacterium]